MYTDLETASFLFLPPLPRFSFSVHTHTPCCATTWCYAATAARRSTTSDALLPGRCHYRPSLWRKEEEGEKKRRKEKKKKIENIFILFRVINNFNVSYEW
jgi:hypothetical protein